MADKYHKTGTTGFTTEQEALAVSAGAGDAGKIVATDAAGVLDASLMPEPLTATSAGAGNAGNIVVLDGGGKLDSTLFPPGFGEDTLLVDATENLSAGSFVNLWNDSGPALRLADASNGRVAHGFVLASVTSGQPATVYGIGQVNDQLSTLTPGVNYFLGTAGALTATVPTTSGHYVQYLGTAHSATALRFIQSTPIVRA